jgi:hypothetical protein
MEEFKQLVELCLQSGDFEFKPTQNKLSIPLLYRVYKKMKAGLTNFDAIKVADGLIIDGHHRFIASIIAQVEIDKFLYSTNHNQISYEWKDVILSTNEYDSPEKISYHNFNDAKRNGITIQEIEKILST